MIASTDLIDPVSQDAAPRQRDALPLAIAAMMVLALLATASVSLDYRLACFS
ncbi:hypothetical protein [Sphingomonas sp. CROZ-RG-20F-R02-07]|uniref:hypothetical protein n=1 Tax=Sphingomonas sp. CROZ-RG-20F-R02-07 TaxID=2914832 RepID=UPI001F5A035C|nr:hypothetical protein [Sphingomonas sp. CROZ-RG-20F-R02-07]